MKKQLFILLAVLLTGTCYGQIIDHFSLPERFGEKKLDVNGGYSKGSFFKLRDTIFYLTKPGRQNLNYYMFYVRDDSLILVDSFISNWGITYLDRGIEPTVEVYNDTAFISTNSRLIKWSNGSIKDSLYKKPQQPFLHKMTLNPAGKPVVVYERHNLATYKDTGWYLDTAKILGNRNNSVINIGYMQDTMVVQAFTALMYLVYKKTVVDSFNCNNYSNFKIHNGWVYYLGYDSFVKRRKNRMSISYDKYPGNKFYRVSDFVIQDGVLWVSATKDIDQKHYKLYFLDGDRWHEVPEEKVQSFTQIDGRTYTDGNLPGRMFATGKMSGHVFFDNGNCKYDTADQPVFVKLRVSGKTWPYFSNDGYYSIRGIKDSTYTITPEWHPLVGSICSPDSVTVTIRKIDSTYSHDFGQILDSSRKDLKIGIGTSVAVKGRVISGVISLENSSYHQYDSVKIRLRYDKRLTNFSSGHYHSKSDTVVTFRVDSLGAYEKRNIRFYLLVNHKNFAVGGTLHLYTEILIKDSILSNNYDTIYKEVLRPFDPNMKESFPEGIIEKPVDKITYTIHFQNVGSSEAINVRVVDTLDIRLPIEYIRVKATSHPEFYSLHVHQNVLTWNFKKINLPDSFTNEPASKGFIAYEAKVKNGFRSPGDQIKNKAYIYFDYEKPVITNTASVRLSDVGSEIPVEVSLNDLVIWPNPFQNRLTLQNNQEIPTKVYLYNSLGKLVLRKNLEPLSTTEISTSELGSGIYYLRNKQSTFKIIKH